MIWGFYHAFGHCFAELEITEILCCWTGSNTDSSSDQDRFAEVYLAVVDCQVSHAAHIGLPGSSTFWKETI